MGREAIGMEGCAVRRLAVIALIVFLSLAAKPKPKPKDAPGPELSEDLNLVSLRVHAIDTIYELDLSPAQLQQLATAAGGCASDHKRTAAQGGNEKLVAAFADFNRALLSRQDDQDIAKLRNHLTELVTADEVHLDDDVVPTEPALAKSPEISRKLTASQIAAYLASHADQITDPAEMMMSDLTELSDKTREGDPAELIKDSADQVGQLVAGSDKKAAAEIAQKAAQWFKTNADLTDDQLVSKHDQLEASAKAVVGDVPPMDILSHWFDNEIATLLSNPQLSQAIESVQAAQGQAN